MLVSEDKATRQVSEAQKVIQISLSGLWAGARKKHSQQAGC